MSFDEVPQVLEEVLQTVRKIEREMAELKLERARPAKATDKMLSVQQVAEQLGVHHNTVRDMITDGRISAARPTGPNGRLRIRQADVDRLKEAALDPDPKSYQEKAAATLLKLSGKKS